MAKAAPCRLAVRDPGATLLSSNGDLLVSLVPGDRTGTVCYWEKCTGYQGTPGAARGRRKIKED